MRVAGQILQRGLFPGKEAARMIDQERQSHLCSTSEYNEPLIRQLGEMLRQGSSLNGFSSRKARAMAATMRGHCKGGMFAPTGP